MLKPKGELSCKERGPSWGRGPSWRDRRQHSNASFSETISKFWIKSMNKKLSGNFRKKENHTMPRASTKTFQSNDFFENHIWYTIIWNRWRMGFHMCLQTKNKLILYTLAKIGDAWTNLHLFNKWKIRIGHVHLNLQTKHQTCRTNSIMERRQ